MNKPKTTFKQTEIGPIPEDWGINELKSSCDLIQYGYTQSASDKPIGPKFLRITDIQNNHIDWDSVPYCKISDEDYKKYRLEEGDIIIARTGASTGTNAIYLKGMPDSVFASYLIRLRTCKKLVPFFVYQFLQSGFYNEYVKGILGGSAQPNANAQQLTGVNIPIPPLTEQHRIAAILSSLDDKIELNRKMNKTPESIAQAIFKRWFVDFEFPNEKGKPYKSSGGKMVKSELGMVPEGWGVDTFGEAVNILDSKRIPLSKKQREQRKGYYPYYGATSVVDYVDDYLFDGVYVLLGEDGSVARDDGSPFVQYVYGKIWVNNHAHVLEGKNSFSTEFVKLFLNQTEITPYVTGAVQPKLNQENMKAIPLVIPPQKTLVEFNSFVQPIYKQIVGMEEQSRTISQIRELLLPRLMCGRARV